MAQDFHAAFGLGESDKAIGSVDAEGVALAAIQGLNQVVKEKESEIRALTEKFQAMEGRLRAMESQLALLLPAQDSGGNMGAGHALEKRNGSSTLGRTESNGE